MSVSPSVCLSHSWTVCVEMTRVSGLWGLHSLGMRWVWLVLHACELYNTLVIGVRPPPVYNEILPRNRSDIKSVPDVADAMLPLYPPTCDSRIWQMVTPTTIIAINVSAGVIRDVRCQEISDDDIIGWRLETPRYGCGHGNSALLARYGDKQPVS